MTRADTLARFMAPGRLIPLLGWIALFLLIIAPFAGSSRYLVYLGTLIALQAALATSLNLLIGYAGQFAMSHAAFYGFGAYLSAVLVAHHGVNFWWSFPATMVAAAILAAAIGYPALRYTGGVYLALITFAFGELARLTAANWQGVTGGPMGMRVLYSPPSLAGINFGAGKGLYGMAIGMFGISLFVVLIVERSRFGRALVAVREDEVLASFLGINVMRHKLAAYVMSSTLAAMAGVAYAPIVSFISPELLSVQQTISLIGVLILGGIGTLAGPIIGTLVFFGVPEVLHVAPVYRLVILGIVVVLVVLYMPEGIAGVINRKLRRLKGVAHTARPGVS